MGVANLLKKVPFFHHLSQEQLDELAAVGRTEEHPPRGIVFSEGDDGDCLYVVLNGRVRVSKDDSGGEVGLATLAEGDFFGEMALFDNSARSATVYTLEPCEFFILGRDEFFSLIARNPQLMPDFLSGMGTRLRGMNEKFLVEMLHKQALQTEVERQRHRALAQLVAGFAHELGAPLCVVQEAAGLLAQYLTPGVVEQMARADGSREALREILDCAALIRSNMDRAAELVQGVKLLSDQEASEPSAEVDIVALMEQVIALYRLRGSRLSVSIDSELPQTERSWTGYPGHLSQILLHLLANADHHAYANGSVGRVDVLVAGTLLRGRPAYCVSVRDHGRGIEEMHQARVFEPFYTTGSVRGGRGLGLSIARNVATESLGGTVDLESVPGAGTTVMVTVPRVVSGQA